jgi:hypothetical protein
MRLLKDENAITSRILTQQSKMILMSKRLVLQKKPPACSRSAQTNLDFKRMKDHIATIKRGM